MKLGTLLCLSFLCATALRADEGMAPEVLYKKYKAAVVKIVGTDYGLDAGKLGTGFFVSGDGEIITNYHVIRDAVNAPTFSAKFILSDGTEIKDFKIADCSDKREIDLCLLKVNYQPKAWFKPHTRIPDVGERVYVIGHPKGLDFSLSDGLVSALRMNPRRVAEIQVSAPVNPGNSGGPIFDKHGSLLGVATYILRESEGLNFGVDAQEVFKYQKTYRNFIASKDFSKGFAKKKQVIAEALRAELIDPIRARLRKGEAPEKIFPNPLKVIMDYDGKRLIGFLPGFYSNCHSHALKVPDSAEVHCVDGNRSDFVLAGTKVGAGFRIGGVQGRVIPKIEPLQTVRYLMGQGQWETAKKKLTAKQIKFMHSVPTVAKCRRINDSPFTEKTECGYSIYNDRIADGSSTNHVFQDGNMLFTASVWTADSTMAGYYYHLNDVFMSTVKVIPTRDAASTSPR